MKTIYKIMTAMIAITMMIAPATAFEFTPNSGETTISIEGNGNTIYTTDHPANGGGIYHSYQKGTLTIPMPTDSTSINAWNYQEIEII